MPRIVVALLLSKAAVLFSTGCSRAGIPPLSFEELIGRVFIHHYTSGFQAKIQPSTSAELFWRLCSVSGCSSGRDWNPNFWASFSLEEGFLHLRDMFGELQSLFHIYGIRTHISHTFPVLFLLGNALFWRQCSLHGLEAPLQSFLLIERFILSWEEFLEGSTSDKIYFQPSILLCFGVAVFIQSFSEDHICM